MTEIVEETRILIDRNDQPSKVGVSRVGPGLYRIEATLSFLTVWLGDDSEIDNADLEMGWLLDVEELEDDRLKLIGARPDPSMECVGAGLPYGFHTSREFERIGNTILELGGNWELFAWGMFSSYVPREAAVSAGFDVRSELSSAVERWPRAPEGQDKGAIECPECCKRMWVPIGPRLLRVRCRRCDHRFHHPPIHGPSE